MPYKNKYKKSANEWFSRFIRLRDTSHIDGFAQCITCKKKKHPKDGDAGHFVSRSHNATLFLEDNVHFQCKACNNPNWNAGGTAKVYREVMIDMYGEDVVLEIEKTSLIPKRFTDMEYIAMTQDYQEKVEKLLSEKGIKKWWKY